MHAKKDIRQFENKGIKTELIDYQINMFKEGFPYIKLEGPAIPGNGVRTFSENQINEIIKVYNRYSKDRDLVKFVPASGAATRMFKNLFQFITDYKNDDQGHVLFLQDQSFNSAYHFISSIANLAFYDELLEVLNLEGLNINDLLQNKDYHLIIKSVLEQIGLNYGALPKGLIRFHQYEDGARFAFEEHLVEGAEYCRQSNQDVQIHFTVSPEHRERFQQLIEKQKDKYEKEFGISFKISFSEQKSSTDTIAVDLQNSPFRSEDGSILFRPGGHGALIENLNELDADVIFIKNIDNIVPDRLKPDTISYKKLIGGLLLQVQEKTFEYLRKLNNNEESELLIDEIIEFATSQLNIKPDSGFNSLDILDKSAFLIEKLNRPIRVCGMVKNEGEPGGGPFWVKNQLNEVSLQIVESSQINPNDPVQQEILKSSTHFNPVDLVCGVKDYEGNKFDLRKYTDPSTGFISIKSKDGRDLKAQELPGLWNGAMANWNTIFVDVPIITFNPVKIVNDLLRETHQ